MLDLSGYNDVLTVEQVAGLLQVSVLTVQRLCRSGQLPARKIGRRWYVPRSVIEKIF